MEKNSLCAATSGGFLFSSVQFTITRKGREKVQGVAEGQDISFASSNGQKDNAHDGHKNFLKDWKALPEEKRNRTSPEGREVLNRIYQYTTVKKGKTQEKTFQCTPTFDTLEGWEDSETE